MVTHWLTRNCVLALASVAYFKKQDCHYGNWLEIMSNEENYSFYWA